jgi:hypothetical protein
MIQVLTCLDLCHWVQTPSASMALRPIPRNQFFAVKTILPIRALFVRVSPDSSQTYLSFFRFSVGFGKARFCSPARERVQRIDDESTASVPLRELLSLRLSVFA